jgi:hypothetical protein
VLQWCRVAGGGGVSGDTAPIRRGAVRRGSRRPPPRSQLPDLIGDAPIEFAHPRRQGQPHLPGGGGETELVLRRRPGAAGTGSHDMSREFRALAVLHKAYPPAPRPSTCDDPVSWRSFFW